METHNTRKEIEVRLAYLKDFPVSPDPECNHSVYDEIIVAFNQLEQSFHHQLQKDREQAYKDGARDVRDFAINEIMKRAGVLRDDLNIFTFDQIKEKADHSELDQPNK